MNKGAKATSSKATKAPTRTRSLPQLLEIVLDLLPLHAEEGTLRETLVKSDLTNALIDAGTPSESSVLLVGLLQRQLDSLALLDRTELARENWVFVSFPASLLARSLVEIMAAPGQAIFPPEYWEQGDHRSEIFKEEQRRLLHRVEVERIGLNPTAPPVRVVHVAWAVIRIGARFLLHRREDRERPGEKSHVLPGGRFNPGDLPPEIVASSPRVLRQLFDAASPLVDAHLDTTLVRELHEELGLRLGDDYQFERWQRLPPFRKLSGAGNRYAYSEYGFQLYTIKLTAIGEVHLLDREAEANHLTWFSATELGAPQRADGASAFVDVLHAAWGQDLESQLAAVPDSGASGYAMTGETQVTDLPHIPGAPLLLGKSGKERALSLMLDEAEWQLLLLLGWHARNFQIDTATCIHLLGCGWVKIDDEVALKNARSLLSKIAKAKVPLAEMREGHYLRLQIDPAILVFGAPLFGYSIDEDDSDGGVLTLVRETVTTPLGTLNGDEARLPINRNTLRILQALRQGNDPDASPGLLADSWERNLRQQLLPEVKRLGLRKLWTTENKAASIVAGIRRIDR
jgi:8-oxo-dGTP pyrophosphatase MutT (NUDIX family)